MARSTSGKKTSSKKKSGDVVKLDMRKTERGKKGGYRYPESEYKIRIDKAERKTAQSGSTQIQLNCTIVAPEKYDGKPLIVRETLSEKAMYRTGWLLDACGIKWGNKIIELPLKKIEGKVVGVLLHDEEYNNRISSRVSEYYTEEEVDGILEGGDDDDEDEDDEDEDELDEDEDDEDEDEDEDDDDDEDDL